MSQNTQKKALVLVDIQNDFLPTGNLPVPLGDEVIDIANSLMSAFDLVVATKDWHPNNHGSFASQHSDKNPFEIIDLHGLQQVLWPDHCIQYTFGSEFASGLQTEKIEKVVYKGSDPKVDSYSGFADNGNRIQTEMHEYLQSQGVTEVFVCGLATDFCVQFTARDSRSRGYETYFIEDASRGISEEGVQAAKKAMLEAGIHMIQSREILH